MAYKVKRVSKAAAPNIASFVSEQPHNQAIPVKVVSGSEGPLTIKQKFQAGYKATVAFVATLATLATQVQTLTPFLPDRERTWIGVGVAIIGTISTFLVKNEEFVENL